MMPLPQVAKPLPTSLSIAFTEPMFNRIQVLLVGAVPAKGRRSITSGLLTCVYDEITTVVCHTPSI